MLRAEDLMIGDWVKTVCPKEESYQRVSDIHFSSYPYIITAGSEEKWFLVEVEPIPLTQEILEKNLKEFILGLNCMYELGGPYCISLEQENCWVFGLATKVARYPMVKIRYVHELQHALRLCGINLEIKI